MYARTADTIAAADIAYINQETICGGTELGLQSYPTFNSPYEILDAVANAGFDWLSTSSNHSMDVGEQGIRNQLAHIETLGLTQTGTHGDESDAQTYRVMNKNGLRIGLLSYTYGLNGFVLPQGKEYLVDLIDEEKIQSDMEAIQAISDVQIVSMHWGEEYQFAPNEEQQQLAQLLSDLGADVIIGTHPHVLQPADILTGEAGNETSIIRRMPASALKRCHSHRPSCILTGRAAMCRSIRSVNTAMSWGPPTTFRGRICRSSISSIGQRRS